MGLSQSWNRYSDFDKNVRLGMHVLRFARRAEIEVRTIHAMPPDATYRKFTAVFASNPSVGIGCTLSCLFSYAVYNALNADERLAAIF